MEPQGVVARVKTFHFLIGSFPKLWRSTGMAVCYVPCWICGTSCRRLRPDLPRFPDQVAGTLGRGL